MAVFDSSYASMAAAADQVLDEDGEGGEKQRGTGEQDNRGRAAKKIYCFLGLLVELSLFLRYLWHNNGAAADLKGDVHTKHAGFFALWHKAP